MVYSKKGTWISWGDWLGNKQVATNKIQFVSFSEAKLLMIKNSIKTLKEYYKFRKRNFNKINLPALPSRTYAKSGWESWGDFLGKK